MKEMSNKVKQYQMDPYLDRSSRVAYLNCECLDALKDFLINKHTIDYELISFSIMPNHIHLLLKPNLKLSTVMQYLKGGSAKMINNILCKRGRFWSNDYFDRYIRDHEHFLKVYHYIKENPKNLSEDNRERRFYSLYE